MLDIYRTSVDLVRALQPVVSQIARHDPDLARQLRKASMAVPLHISEGSHARGKNRAAKYQIGCSEAREAEACCDCGEAADYIAPVSLEIRRMFRAVIGTLVVNIRRG